MAWLESHQQIERHPKTIRLMQAMGWDIDTTIGKLHRFWWWVLDFAPNGDLSKYSPELIGTSLGLSADMAVQFVDKLADMSFIDRGEGVFRVHSWLDYAGRYLRDTKFKRHPELWDEAKIIHANPCNSTVNRQSADSQPTVSRLSAVPNQPNPTLPIERENTHARPKGIEEVLEFIKTQPGYEEPIAREWHASRERQGWVTGGDKPITNWQADLTSWILREARERRNSHRNTGKQRQTEQERDEAKTGLIYEKPLKKL